MPSQANAQYNDIYSLQAQIQSLLATVQSLQAQLSALQGGQGGQYGYYCYSFNYNFSIGMRDSQVGGEVSRLQQYLKGTGDYTYPQITGYFGPVTFDALKRWQQRNGLYASGILDAQTREAIRSRSCNNNYPVPGYGVTDFRVTPSYGQAPLLVTFTATRPASDKGSYYIDFGDGQEKNVTESYENNCNSTYYNNCTYTVRMNASHTYNSSGTYTATLNRRYNCTANTGTVCPALYSEEIDRVTVSVSGYSNTNREVYLGEQFTLRRNESARIIGTDLRVEAVNFYNSPCTYTCIWSGVGVSLRYTLNGQVAEGINLAQAFGYETTIVQTDNESYVRLRIDK